MGTKPIKEIVPESPSQGGLVEVASERLVDGAMLESVSLSGDCIKPKIVQRLGIEGSRITGSVLAGSKLPGVRMVDCCFDRADLAGATWNDARLVRTRLEESRLTGFDARMSELRDVVFHKCKMPESFLSETQLTRVRFEECQMPGLDLSNAKIHSAVINNCDARSLNLLGAKIEFLDLRGSMIDGIAIDPLFVNGLIIDATQATAIAQSLGVRVADLG